MDDLRMTRKLFGTDGIRGVEKSLGHSGRILIRYSGTEPLLRIMVEGEDETKLHRFGQDLVGLVKKYIGK